MIDLRAVHATQIQISEPDSNGVVSIYVPDAKVLNVRADNKTMTDPITEKGLFTQITGEEKKEAFADAQKKMREEAEADQALLRRSKENAKTLLSQYVLNMGEEMGVDLSVKWVDIPDASSSSQRSESTEGGK